MADGILKIGNKEYECLRSSIVLNRPTDEKGRVSSSLKASKLFVEIPSTECTFLMEQMLKEFTPFNGTLIKHDVSAGGMRKSEYEFFDAFIIFNHEEFEKSKQMTINIVISPQKIKLNGNEFEGGGGELVAVNLDLVNYGLQLFNMTNGGKETLVEFVAKKLSGDVKSNMQTVIKVFGEDVGKYVRVSKAITRFSALGSIATSLADGKEKGFKPHHAADITLAATFLLWSTPAGWIVGTSLLLIDLGCKSKFDKSLTELIFDRNY